jgi:spore germination protein GerM
MKSNLLAFLALVALSSLGLMLGIHFRAANHEPVIVIPKLKVEPKHSKTRLSQNVSEQSALGVSPNAGAEVTLFVPEAANQDLGLVRVTAKASDSTPLAALRALAAFEPHGLMESPLPKETKVLGLTVQSDGTAVANFSQEIVDNFPGGSRTEQIMLDSIVDTLTQFPSIKKVMIHVGGKPIDTIGGHIELDEPLERDLEFMVNDAGASKASNP